jgi:hypothetical protein
MIQERRNRAVARLIERINHGDLVALDLQDEIRVAFTDPSKSTERINCKVCEVPLVGRQRDFCFGHWDYVTFNLPSAPTYHELLIHVAAWLRTQMTDLRIERRTAFWLAVIKGHSRCEVCNCMTHNVECLVGSNGTEIKTHTVCEDHAFIRLQEP